MGELVDGCDELVRRGVWLPGGDGQVPAVDQAVEYHEAGKRLSVYLAVGGGDGALEGTGGADGLTERLRARLGCR